MKKLIFNGAGVAIVTPFTEDGINFEEFAKIIDDQIKGGTDAIIVAGTTGEAATMSDDEHKKIIEFAIKHTNGRVPVVAGTGSNDTAYAIQLSKHAEKAGADGLLLVTPYYNKCTQNGLIKHFTAIADSVKIPCILYDVPSRTGVSIKVPTYAELAKHPNIVAVKEANGDLSEILRLRRDVPELAVYSGNDDQIVPIMSLGGVGVISVLSNVAPRETHEMCDLCGSGNFEKAAKLQIEYSALIDALFSEVNPIPVKTAMRLMGYNVGALRLPLSDMDEKNLEKLKTALKSHDLI